MVMRSVKIVALRTQYLSLDVVINLMRCFPCSTSLYISVKIMLFIIYWEN
jgi:hypothetical protein